MVTDKEVHAVLAQATVDLPACLDFALPHPIVHVAHSQVKQRDLSLMQARDSSNNSSHRKAAVRTRGFQGCQGFLAQGGWGGYDRVGEDEHEPHVHKLLFIR